MAAEFSVGLPAMHTGVPFQGISDVALDGHARANGQVVTSAGSPLSSATVVLQRDGCEVARTITNKSGGFTIAGLNGGLYQLTAVAASGNTGQAVFRFWSYQAAPPSAERQVQLVVSDTILRGQIDSLGPLQRVTTNPWVSAAAVTGLVAIPIALSNDGS